MFCSKRSCAVSRATSKVQNSFAVLNLACPGFRHVTSTSFNVSKFLPDDRYDAVCIIGMYDDLPDADDRAMIKYWKAYLCSLRLAAV